MDLLPQLAQFGIPGLLTLIAYMFWDKQRRIAQFALVSAVLGAIATLVVQLWPAEYELQLLPSQPSWAGLYASGQPVDKVQALLLRNGSEYRREVRSALDIASRSLNLKYDPDSQDTVVRFNTHPQGTLSQNSLATAGWRRVTDTVNIRSAALTGRVERLGDAATVLPESVVRDDFARLRVVVNQWLFRDNGVEVTVYSGDDAITRSILSRDGELSFSHDNRTILLKILHLGFQQSEYGTSFVQFLLLHQA